jgi:transposase
MNESNVATRKQVQAPDHAAPKRLSGVGRLERIEHNYIRHGKTGILGSKASRKTFFSDSSHSAVFHYTPTHSSWGNQIEVWFSILVKKYLKRSSFASKEALKEGIAQFVTYFNQTMGRAFRWKFRSFQGGVS